MPIRTSAMTESAILAALTLILTLIGLYVPFMGGLAILIWPLPTVVTIVRHGVRAGIMQVVVATALIAMLVEPMTAVRLSLAFGFVGVAMGLGLRSGWTGTRVLASSVVVSIISKAAVLYVLFLITGIEPFSMQFDMMESSLDSTLGVYESVGMNEDQLAETRAIALQNISIFRLLVPLFVLAIGLTDAAATFIIAGVVLARLGAPVPTLPPFRKWRMSPVFLYLFAFSLIGLYWGEKDGMELLRTASVNVFFTAMLAGFIDALALYAYAVRRYSLPGLLAAFILIVVMFSGFLARIFVFVGLLDTLLDYRKRYWREDGE